MLFRSQDNVQGDETSDDEDETIWQYVSDDESPTILVEEDDDDSDAE